jgi:hypothetical protein
VRSPRGHAGLCRRPDADVAPLATALDPATWRELLDELMFLVAARFARAESRRTARPGTGQPGAAFTRAPPAAATTSADLSPNWAHNKVTLPY